jgi:hypothetical protein
LRTFDKCRVSYPEELLDDSPFVEEFLTFLGKFNIHLPTENLPKLMVVDQRDENQPFPGMPYFPFPYPTQSNNTSEPAPKKEHVALPESLKKQASEEKKTDLVPEVLPKPQSPEPVKTELKIANPFAKVLPIQPVTEPTQSTLFGSQGLSQALGTNKPLQDTIIKNPITDSKGSLFGGPLSQPTQPVQQDPKTDLFSGGGLAQKPQTTPTLPTGGLFGGGGLMAQTQPAPQAQPTLGGLFGGGGLAQPQAPGGGLFGAGGLSGNQGGGLSGK